MFNDDLILCCLFSKAQIDNGQLDHFSIMWQNCQSSHFSTMRQPESVLVCQCTVTAVHVDTSSLTWKHSALQWFPLSAVMCQLIMCSVYIWDAGAETRSSATADKLETGILIFVAQPIFHGCTCHRRSMAYMTDIPQAHWKPGENLGTGNCRQVFNYTFEGFSDTWYGGGASSAIQRPK